MKRSNKRFKKEYGFDDYKSFKILFKKEFDLDDTNPKKIIE